MADRHHDRHRERHDRRERRRYSPSSNRDGRHYVEDKRERRRSRSPHYRKERRHSSDDHRRTDASDDHRHERDARKFTSDLVRDRRQAEHRPRQDRDTDMRVRGKGRWQKNDDSASQYGGEGAPVGEGDDRASEKDKKLPQADYGLSGKLTAETNTFKGEVIKYNEPPEARQPKTKWRFYQFKGDEQLNVLYIHRQSAYLIGRDRKIVDFPVDHPSCSKQHAVLQYRLMDYVKSDNSKGRRVRPYIIDLGSTNGTYLNNQRIDPSRYYELQEKDMLKFGFSSREYILLHENSRASDDEDDD